MKSKKKNKEINQKKWSLTINAKKWRCGANGPYRLGQGETALLNSEGYKCCLGFACQQFGYKGGLTNNAEPNELKHAVAHLTEYYGGDLENTSFTTEAISINDDENLPLNEKISKLTKLCKSEGIEVTFTNIPKATIVTVNGEPKEIHAKELSYDDVIILAKMNGRPSVIVYSPSLSKSFHWSDEPLEVVEGMRFTVVHTTNA